MWIQYTMVQEMVSSVGHTARPLGMIVVQQVLVFEVVEVHSQSTSRRSTLEMIGVHRLGMMGVRLESLGNRHRQGQGLSSRLRIHEELSYGSNLGATLACFSHTDTK